MKKPIEWHQNCLKNSVNYYNKQFERIRKNLHKVAELQRENDFYKLQIETAIKKGKDGFDQDRFLVKKK